jgi:internalin A
MPKGILSRLICRVHQYILGEWFWRYGVVLEDKEGNQARIVLNEVERVLKITVQGEKPAYLLRIIRHHTEAIHHNLKNPPLEEKVPCMCVECRQDKNPYLHNYATLKKFQEKGRTTRECEKSAEVADIAQMLEGILDTKKGQTKILFDLIDRANVSGFFMEIERLGVSGNQIASLRKEYIHDGGNFQYADKLKVWVMDYFS